MPSQHIDHRDPEHGLSVNSTDLVPRTPENKELYDGVGEVDEAYRRFYYTPSFRGAWGEGRVVVGAIPCDGIAWMHHCPYAWGRVFGKQGDCPACNPSKPKPEPKKDGGQNEWKTIPGPWARIWSDARRGTKRLAPKPHLGHRETRDLLR